MVTMYAGELSYSAVGMVVDVGSLSGARWLSQMGCGELYSCCWWSLDNIIWAFRVGSTLLWVWL